MTEIRELREEIANLIGDSLGWPKDRRESSVRLAALILAIPRLQEALRQPVSHYPNGIPRGDPNGCEAPPKQG